MESMLINANSLAEEAKKFSEAKLARMDSFLNIFEKSAKRSDNTEEWPQIFDELYFQKMLLTDYSIQFIPCQLSIQHPFSPLPLSIEVKYPMPIGLCKKTPALKLAHYFRR